MKIEYKKIFHGPQKSSGPPSYILNVRPLRTTICFNLKTCLSNNIENIFIDLLFPKTRSITIGVIYKPPNQTRCLEQIITEFETLDLNY